MSLLNLLKLVELISAAGILVTIVLQTRSSGVGTMFGGGGGAGLNSSKRGMEAFLYNATIVLGVVFALTALAIAALSV